MSMLLINKELAEAVVESKNGDYCHFCKQSETCVSTYDDWAVLHTPECIVARAKLLLEQEWGIKS